MLFALHDDDGKIHQANKVYDDHRKYVGLLRDLGHRFVAVNAPGLLPPEHWHVDIKPRYRGQRLTELKERPVMQIEVTKTRIKAGSKDDSAVLKNIPAGARFEVLTSNTSIHSGLLDGTELELFIPVPCIYRVTLDLWPYKQFQVDIEAYA